ncbi:MAG: hypothetical protein GC206_13365 [Alphaproteobacteria bacterium]|nr:hypothetical protein [Alphaproteobacteria bacterium]
MSVFATIAAAAVSGGLLAAACAVIWDLVREFVWGRFKRAEAQMTEKGAEVDAVNQRVAVLEFTLQHVINDQAAHREQTTLLNEVRERVGRLEGAFHQFAQAQAWIVQRLMERPA